ncbi:MAG TPA: 50S ribosomal protein L29 [Ktedonobacterales bacterium]
MSKLSERRREIHGLSVSQAHQELADQRRKLFELRLQKVRGEVKNNRQFPQVKADIARLMQHLGELQHAQGMVTSGELSDETAGEK